MKVCGLFLACVLLGSVHGDPTNSATNKENNEKNDVLENTPSDNVAQESVKIDENELLQTLQELSSVIKIVPSPDLTKENNQHSGRMSEDDPTVLRFKLREQQDSEMIKDMLERLEFLGDKIPTDLNAMSQLIEQSEAEIKTNEDQQAQDLYEKGLSFLRKGKSYREQAYNYLNEASHRGHLDAKAEIAWLLLFGYPRQNIEHAKEIFEMIAEKGNPGGNMGMGFLYASGIAVNASQPRALIYYTMAAVGGHPWAQMALGYRQSAGITLQALCEKSLDYYRTVASSVADKVRFSGGPIVHRARLLDEHESGYSSGAVDTDLIQYYQLLAEKGDVSSQVGLGQLHYQGGRGLELDYKKAMQYFTQAANAGNAIAMAYLGKIYLDGSDDIPQSNETALKYFRKAADQNNPMGQSGLGLMYLHGKGVEKDYIKALKHFSLAADQGWVDGQLNLGLMYYNGIGVKRDFKTASKFLTLASQHGHILAFHHLGLMHANGQGTLHSCSTAVELFKMVAERGHWSEMLMQAHANYRNGNFNEAYVQYALLSELGYEVAQSNTAFILDKDEVSLFTHQQSLERALVYWRRAAAQGYSPAQVKIGDYYYYGLGTNVDYEMAAFHYRMASEQQQNAQAMFNLGYMHEQGLGMAQDIHLAKRCYDLAAETSPDAKVPVALALYKLQFIFALQSLAQGHFYILEGVHEFFGTNWDLFSIFVLGIILVFVIFFNPPH